jgi:2'-5' RNA ligase
VTEAARVQQATAEESAGRLFVGCAVDDRVRSALQELLRREVLPGRVVPPENFHLTFRFLGKTSVAQLARLVDVMSSTSMGAAIDVELGGYGAFPRIDRATVMWLGITRGGDEIKGIAANVETAVQRAGFAAESRPFNGHLTLSRLKPAQDIRTIVSALPDINVHTLVDRVTVFRSHQVGGGVRYEALRSFSLA